MAMRMRVRTMAVAALAPMLLGGCLMTDGLYGGVSVGAGDYYGGDPYGYPYGYDPYGGYYGGASYGWYDNYYYPGNGAYVYDRAGRAYRMRAQDRAYWEARRENRIERREARTERRENRLERREMRAERRANRPSADPAAIARREAIRDARRGQNSVFNREARQALRQAVRSRQSGEANAEQQP
jgi:hypothetical protein